MSKSHRARSSGGGSHLANAGKSSRSNKWLGLVLAAGVVIAAVAWQSVRTKSEAAARTPTSDASSTATADAKAPLPTNQVAQAIMVTVELDFGGKPPSIKEALKEVERRHQPDDGKGRTFAILDAYGDPTPAGKLHMSMHV